MMTLDSENKILSRQSHGFSYKVDDSIIIVRNRPQSLEMNFDKDLDPEDMADAYLSVTDTFVVPPSNKPFVWFPWNEDRHPIPEMYYATNRALNWWVLYQKLKTIQIFCDGGTHRSVTVFGAFLRTYFTAQEAEAIVRTRVEINPYPNTNSSTWSQPLEYIESYLETFPQDRLLFLAMKKDRLGRLDQHCKAIYDKIKERYGDNKRT